jgi:uncharacterized membrane protein YbhN (UPF0104 family)
VPSLTPSEPRRVWLRWLRVGLAVVLGAAAVVALRDQIPSPSAVAAVLARADWRWIVAAVLIQVLSQVAFARQQQHLLAGAAVRVRRGTALATAYARSAMGLVLPAGGAVSAGFAYRQFRRWGATATTATVVTVLSGVASTASLALLSAAAFGRDATTGLVDLGQAHPVAVLAGLGAATAAAAVILATRRDHLIRLMSRWPHVANAGRRLRQAAIDVRGIGARRWIGALGWAAASWLLDAACLFAAVRAVDLASSWRHVVVAYLAVQVARQLPATPGGIGLVEAGLLTALATTGTSLAAAAAALCYRFVSFWLVLPIGLAGYLRLRHRPPVVG